MCIAYILISCYIQNSSEFYLILHTCLIRHKRDTIKEKTEIDSDAYTMADKKTERSQNKLTV